MSNGSLANAEVLAEQTLEYIGSVAARWKYHSKKTVRVESLLEN